LVEPRRALAVAPRRFTAERRGLPMRPIAASSSATPREPAGN